MHTIYKSNSYWIDFGWESKKDLLLTPFNELQKEVNKFISYANSHNYEIKSIVPLTTSICNSCTWDQGGYGYGMSQITGILIIMQRSAVLTQEEYEEYISISTIRDKISECEAEIHRLSDIKLDYQNCPISGPLEIKEAKKLFSGTIYRVHNKDFETREEAQAYLDELKNRPQFEQIPAMIADIEKKIEQYQTDIQNIEEKYFPSHLF